MHHKFKNVCFVKSDKRYSHYHPASFLFLLWLHERLSEFIFFLFFPMVPSLPMTSIGQLFQIMFFLLNHAYNKNPQIIDGPGMSKASN